MVKVLAVDDEDFNRDILGEYLDEAGYETVLAVDGVDALEKLESHPDTSVIVLDRMMPRLGGIEVLSRIKADPRFNEMPVILQTAAAAHDQVCEGIEAGAFYYLTKPYEERVLLSILRAAVNESEFRQGLRAEAQAQKHLRGLMRQGLFRFRTLDEARALAIHIAAGCPDPENVVYGLSELMINAIEHGNLGITYSEKTGLVLSGTWLETVETRLETPEQQDRYATLEFATTVDEIRMTITDCGDGFDYADFLGFKPERLTDPHGRGIATARMMSFDTVDYIGCGNQVICRIGVR